MNEEQKKELKRLIDEITKESKKVVKDYTNNPSEMSGSITQVHTDSPILNDDKE